MASTKLTSEQAFQLSQAYSQLREAVGNYRLDNWNQLTPAQRQKLEDYEWTLATNASDFLQKSVVLLLTAPETQQAVNNIVATTKDLVEAVKTLQGINKIFGVLTAAFTLGGAIISGNPIAIAQAIEGAIKAIKA